METVTKCCPTRTRRIVSENGVVTTSTEYDYNPANQLESLTESNGAGGTLRSALIGFDERGNRETQMVTLPGGIEKTTQYDWDFQNRLVGVTDPQGGAHAYAYDYRSRRIARSEPGGATAVSWSGGLSLAEYPVSRLQSAIANPQSPIVEYRRGPDMGGGIGGLLHSLRNGAPKYNLGNGRGDVVAQSDATGALTWTASYEAFGTRPVETGSNADRQRANTKEEDPTGLLWEHFRYRDLETGVWLSRDPAGFVDGPNLYAYVRQNPWTFFDPLGLELTSEERENVSKLDRDSRKYLRENGDEDRVVTPASVEGRMEDSPSYRKDVAERYDGQDLTDEEVTFVESARRNYEATKLVKNRNGELSREEEMQQGFEVYNAMLELTTTAASIPFLGIRAPVVPNAGEKSLRSTAVIGKVDDIRSVRSNEHTLLKHLPNRGSPKANWKQNSSVLRREMSKGKPIRDGSTSNGELVRNTGFLRAERNLLHEHGWNYNPSNQMWTPPR